MANLFHIETMWLFLGSYSLGLPLFHSVFMLLYPQALSESYSYAKKSLMSQDL